MLGTEEKKKIRLSNKKSLKVTFIKRMSIFFAFEIIFTCLTMPLFIFYGPFENVKRTLVGMSWNTLNHQYIARFFLSDEAINRIIGSSLAVDPVEAGEEIKELKFGVKHTDRIDVFNIDGGDFVGKMITVYDPTRIEVGYSNIIPKAGQTTSTIAKRNNAVAAINAGGFMDQGWAGTGGAPMGFIIHDGKVVYNQLSNKVKQDTAGFTDKGMLIVGKHSVDQLLKLGIKEAVSFGPPLIVNGKPTITKGDGGWGIAPRTAIAQKEDGTVLLLVIDGRRIDSIGASLRDVQDIFLKYGAINAVNLDGGSSATMFYNSKIINRPSDTLGERAVPSVFMVVPEKVGGQ